MNKLLGRSNGKRGARRAGAWPLECKTVKDRGMVEENRKVWMCEGGEMKQGVRDAKRRGWKPPTGSVISEIRETAHNRMENEKMVYKT